MNKQIVLKITIVLGFLLLVVQVLFLDFDDLKSNLTLTNLVNISVPLLVVIGTWLYLKEGKKKETR